MNKEELPQEGEWLPREKVFNFPNGILTITEEARNLDSEQKDNIFADIKDFEKAKPERKFIGRDGSLFLLPRSNCCIKEQITSGQKFKEEHIKLNKLIEETESFPMDIKLCPLYAVLQSSRKKFKFFRKPFDQKTSFQSSLNDVPGTIELEENIDTYIIMPFINKGVNLDKLRLYGLHQLEDQDVEETVKNLLEKGIIKNREDAVAFSNNELHRIETALINLRNENPNQPLFEVMKALLGSQNATRDFAGRNVVIDSTSDPLNYYLIDL